MSDDEGLGWVATQMKIPLIRSLSLVDKMFKAKTITIQEIKAMAGYLDYMSDLPGDWRTHGHKLFGVPIP